MTPLAIARAALPLGIAALLGLAAFAKAAAPEGTLALLEGALAVAVPAWTVLAVSFAEFALAVALVLPATRHAAMAAAALFFLVSIGVLLLAQTRGDVRSCGCFGRFSPSVRGTVLLDGLLLAGVGLWLVCVPEGRVPHAFQGDSLDR